MSAAGDDDGKEMRENLIKCCLLTDRMLGCIKK